MNKPGNSKIIVPLEEELEDLEKKVGDFYAWSRDYWIELGRRHTDGAASGMLNFGLWDDDTETMFEAQENLRKLIVQSIGVLPSGAHGLEIGCGIGGFGIWFVQERDIELVCMDLVPAHLEIARSLAHDAGVDERIKFHQGNSMDIPLPDGAFDFSYCVESSFHYEDKLAFFRENYRVLKEGAVAVVADITCEDNTSVAFKKGNFFYSVQGMRWSMEEAGFTVEQIVPIGDRVFHQLRAYVEHFNAKGRNKLYRYWNLVLRNYAELFAREQMGYDVFILRK